MANTCGPNVGVGESTGGVSGGEKSYSQATLELMVNLGVEIMQRPYFKNGQGHIYLIL